MEVESLYVDDHIIFEKQQQNRELWQQLKQKETEELALFRQIEESIQNQFSSFNPTLTPSIPSLPNTDSIHSISPGALKVTSSSAGLELDLGSPSPQEPRPTSVSNVQSSPTNHFTQRSPEPIYKPYSISPFHDTNDRTIALPDRRNYNEISKRFNDPNSSNRHSVVEDNRSENGMESFQFDDSHTWGDVTIDEAPSFLVKRAEPAIGKSFLFDETELQDITSSNTTTSASASTPTSADRSSQLSNDSHEASLPSVPQSNLIKSLFPGLQKDKSKEKTDINKKAGVNPNVQNLKVQSKDSPSATSTPSEHLSEELQQKLKELEIEISKFKAENENLKKVQTQNETIRVRLEKEKSEFENYKTATTIQLDESQKKLKKERALFEKHRRLTSTLPTRKERNEIEDLRKQITELQSSIKQKDTRLKMTEERYKRRVEELLKSNKELQEEIKVLEGERINWLSEKQTVGKTSGSGMRAPKVKNNMTGSLDSSSFGSTTPRQLSQSTKLPSRPRISASSPPQTENVPTQKSRPIVKSKPKLSSSPSSSSLSSSSSSHLPSGLASSVSMSSSVSRPGRRVHGNLSTSMYKQHDDLDGERMLGISDTLSEVSTVYSNTTNDFVNRDWEQFFNNVERASGLNGILENNIYPDGKRERIYADGTRVVLYKNGTTKEYKHGGATIVRFMNGDMKETTSTHTLYYYSSTRTTHTTYPSGLEIFEFSNGQVEKRHPNGTNEIYFPDKTVKIVYKNGMEKSIFPDGTVQVVDEKGWRTVVWKDGSKEIYTPTYKTRIQPDGTTKIVYEDGTQETRYPDGRVRVKNKLGLIVQDGYDSTDSKSFDIPSNLLLSHSQLDQYSVNNDDDAHKDNELEIKNLNVKLPGSSYKHNIEIEDDESPSSEDQQSQEESYDVSLQAEEAVDIDYDISENIGSKVGGLVM